MLPTDAKARKAAPLYSGFVCYFPDGMVAVAMLSHDANEQHNPGEPVHWAKEKSTDEKDALMRHLVDPVSTGGDIYDTDRHLHATKKAWRAMADLQRLLESGVPVKAQFVYTSEQEAAIRAAGGDPGFWSRITSPPPKPVAFEVDSVSRKGPAGYFNPPRICPDCGVDLDSTVRHAATCLAGC